MLVGCGIPQSVTYGISNDLISIAFRALAEKNPICSFVFKTDFSNKYIINIWSPIGLLLFKNDDRAGRDRVQGEQQSVLKKNVHRV